MLARVGAAVFAILRALLDALITGAGFANDAYTQGKKEEP
jgi:hypothetical protein